MNRLPEDRFRFPAARLPGGRRVQRHFACRRRSTPDNRAAQRHPSLSPMRNSALVLLAALPAALPVVAFADPADDVGAAIEKLNEQPNYTWKLTFPSLEERGVGGTMLGRTRTDGLTLLLLLGGFYDPLVAYADGRATVRLRDRWIVASDLPAPFRPDEFARLRAAAVVASAGARRSVIEDLLANSGPDAVHELFTSMSWLLSEPASFLPAIVLARIHPELFAWRVEGDAIVAKFDERADDLVVGRSSANRAMIRRGLALAGPRSHGTIRFFLDKGALRKLEVASTTTRGDPRIDARIASITRNPLGEDPTRVIEFLDVGTTKVELPPGAAEKLGLASP